MLETSLRISLSLSFLLFLKNKICCLAFLLPLILFPLFCWPVFFFVVRSNLLSAWFILAVQLKWSLFFTENVFWFLLRRISFCSLKLNKSNCFQPPNATALSSWSLVFHFFKMKLWQAFDITRFWSMRSFFASSGRISLKHWFGRCT